MRVYIMMTYLVQLICDFLSYSNIIHFMNLKWLKSLEVAIVLGKVMAERSGRLFECVMMRDPCFILPLKIRFDSRAEVMVFWLEWPRLRSEGGRKAWLLKYAPFDIPKFHFDDNIQWNEKERNENKEIVMFRKSINNLCIIPCQIIKIPSSVLFLSVPFLVPLRLESRVFCAN